ncbi:hypothetical protein DLAC_04446 [Tieghemostelium lacteum]|uniref:Uncharacterized protein n=1 Tax=Tieghemostelium lacteum TaxID=361077 RepID=A0A151ZJI2_TIELA|nr:hypothetical protein DLAC_04446 [Tieghemostelium lacteum]|eukprot:KYQ94158.1 hypothetical protein DLAC_04446 [Tieghemostelium lacteum]
MSIIPNLLTQNILNKILNSYGKTNQPVVVIAEFIKKFSVVCKLWKSDILRKLVLNVTIDFLYFAKYQRPLVVTAIKLMQIYGVQFKLNCKAKETETLQMFRNQINKMDSVDGFENFSNLNTILLEVDKYYNNDIDKLRIQLKTVKETRPHIKICISHYFNITDPNWINLYTHDNVVNKLAFGRISIKIDYSVLPPLPTPPPKPNSLVKLELFNLESTNTEIIEYILKYCSMSLQHLEIKDNFSQYNLENLTDIPMPSLKCIYYKTSRIYPMESVVKFINSTYSKKVSLSIKIKEYEPSQFKHLVINNHNIKNFKFSGLPRDITYLDLWQDLGTLKNINVYYHENLKGYNSYTNLEKLKINTGKYLELYDGDASFKSFLNVLHSSRNLILLKLGQLRSSELVVIMQSIKTLTKLWVELVYIGSQQNVNEIFNEIYCHQTLKKLYIYEYNSIPAFQVSGNFLQFLIDTLERNHVISDLQLPEVSDSSLSIDLLNQLDNTLSRNHSILFIGLTTEIEISPNYPELLNILNKYLIETFLL